jgi:hypothetical protein
MTATLALAADHWFTLGALLCLFLLLLRGLIRLRGTTLTAACLWALGSTVSLAVVAYLANYPGNKQIGGQSAWRFAALVTTLCPLMAVLGAKRPQDKGWHWVVASLWLVLVWPAGQAVLSQSGGLDLFIAWKLFLAGLIALGPLNYLPTRFWLAAILVSLGQTVLLSEYLWEVPGDATRWLLPAGVGCLFLAAAIVTWQCRGATPPAGDAENALATHTRQWKNFRDAYGAFWALRILARVNQTAELSNWPMRLTWTGFGISADDQLTADQQTELDQAMATLLRRFT